MTKFPMTKFPLFSLAVHFVLMAAVQRPIAATITHATHFSKYMGNKPWGFNIYLPPGYNANPQKRYPVIYFLHGGGGDENQLTYYVNSFVDPYITQKKVPECIVVFPSCGTESFFLDNGIIVDNQGFNPDSYFIKEFLPHIDSTYRTIKDRKSRAITGMSMGGYGTYHFAFKYPELFSAAGPFSGGGPYVKSQPRFTNYSDVDDPHVLVSKNAAQLSGRTRLYISVGANELGLTPYNKEMADSCKKYNIAYVFNVVPNVGHDMNAQMQVNGVAAVQYITQGFTSSVGIPAASGIAHRNVATISLQGNTLHVGSPRPQAMVIDLFTPAGRMAGSFRTSGKNAKLDLANFVQGTYWVRLRCSSGMMEKRIFLN